MSMNIRSSNDPQIFQCLLVLPQMKNNLIRIAIITYRKSMKWLLLLLPLTSAVAAITIVIVADADNNDVSYDSANTSYSINKQHFYLGKPILLFFNQTEMFLIMLLYNFNFPCIRMLLNNFFYYGIIYRHIDLISLCLFRFTFLIST